MPEDISELVRFKGVITHRTGLPKHHRGTSSKQPPEAMAEKGMKSRRRRASRPDVLGEQLCKTKISSTGIEADTKIRTILRALEGG